MAQEPSAPSRSATPAPVLKPTPAPAPAAVPAAPARPLPARVSTHAHGFSPTNLYASPAFVAGGGAVVFLYGLLLFAVLSNVEKQRRAAAEVARAHQREWSRAHVEQFPTFVEPPAPAPAPAPAPVKSADATVPPAPDPKSAPGPVAKAPDPAPPRPTAQPPDPPNVSPATTVAAKDEPKTEPKGKNTPEPTRAVALAPKPAEAVQALKGESNVPGLGPFLDPEHDCLLAIEGEQITIVLPGTMHALIPELNVRTAPRSLTEVAGNFTATVRVAGKIVPGAQPLDKMPFAFQGAGLLLWQDENNYVRLERSTANAPDAPMTHKIMLEVYRDGKPAGGAAIDMPNKPFFLRLERQEGDLISKFSPDGKTWIPLKRSAVSLPDKLMVGISASNLSPKSFRSQFMAFNLVRNAPGPAPKPVAAH